MKLFYFLSPFISHQQAGKEYLHCLRLLDVTLASSPEQSDVVIIHDEPTQYHEYFKKYPFLKNKYVIAYAVWEADFLPQQYIDALCNINEVWTCSDYSYAAFRQHHSTVVAVPHVVPLHVPSSKAIADVKQMLKHDESKYYFYTVVDAINPRKNFKALMHAFMKVQKRCARDVVLVVKQYRYSVDITQFSDVVSINDALDDDAMAALHQVCDCFVSAHCAEAWGLSIADALACGTMVVATGYSGNMEFMNEDNAYPVAYALKNIEPDDVSFQPDLFNTQMQWAYVDVDDLAQKMFHCYTRKKDPERQQHAKKVTQQFSHQNIATLIKERLDAIAVMSF